MKIQNAISKLTKSGFNITTSGQFFTANKQGLKYVIEFWRNGSSEDITCISYRHEDDKSDSMTDYCANFFCDNLTQAIRYVTRA